MKFWLSILLCAFLLSATSVMAIDLQTAKAKGLVGETPTGYLAPVSNPTPAVKQLINSINTKRKAKYQEVATGNNASLQAVELLAGKRAIEKSAPGHYVKIGGAWKKK